MRDPHVNKLIYRLEISKGISFTGAPSIEEDRDSFHICLDGNCLTIEVNEHFPTPDDARKIVEPFLRSWEIDAALFHNQPEIQFIYENAEVIDLDPPPPGSTIVLKAHMSAYVLVPGNVTLHVNRASYPSPPTMFVATPSVEILWQRYWGYRENREPLLSMAYYCLTYIEQKFSERKTAAKELGVSKKVLDRLGSFVSRRGDSQTARKVVKDSDHSSLSQQEIAWIDTLIKIIIRRMGERSSVPTLPQITMNDLPFLDSI